MLVARLGPSPRSANRYAMSLSPRNQGAPMSVCLQCRLIRLEWSQLCEGDSGRSPHMLRIAEFEPIATDAGALYRPRVYADENAARWDGYIVFFPLGTGTVISTPRETTQSDFASLQTWASRLDRVYLEGALVRALDASGGVVMTASLPDLVAAETRAATDAIALHRAAERAGAEAASELTAGAVDTEAR